MDERKVAKKSCTTLLCELTRLKSQQKYLECSQVKLNPDNFPSDEDVVDDNGVDGDAGGGGKGVQAIIREIEDLKITLARDLDEEKMSTKREVENMWIFVNAIRDDVLDGERLKQYSMQSIRDRIISIHSMLVRMSQNNEQTLKEVQRKIEDIESDTKILLK